MCGRRALSAIAVVVAALVATGLLVGQAHEHGDQPAEGPEGGAVTGRLLYSNRDPAARLPVVLRGALPSRTTRRAITDTQGRFRAANLEAGRYRLFELRVYLSAKQGKCEVLARRDLKVADETLDLGELVLTPKTIPPAGR